MEKIYVVKYYGGSHDDYHEVIIFATHERTKATRYVTKFNKILNKWKSHYQQFEDGEPEFSWIKKEHIQKHFLRWFQLRSITKCYYDEIELR
jgi:hypothetical protein